jgi:hypothetical protein
MLQTLPPPPRSRRRARLALWRLRADSSRPGLGRRRRCCPQLPYERQSSRRRPRRAAVVAITGVYSGQRAATARPAHSAVASRARRAAVEHAWGGLRAAAGLLRDCSRAAWRHQGRGSARSRVPKYRPRCRCAVRTATRSAGPAAAVKATRGT